MVNCQLHHLTSECHIYTLQKGGPLISTVSDTASSTYLSILTMRRYVACDRGCLDSGCVGVSFP